MHNRIEKMVLLEALEENTEKYLAVSRPMEIAGEAAKYVPLEIRSRYPDVDWRKIIGFRDVLAHGYLSLQSEIIWDAAVNKAPEARDALIRILAEHESR
ncbi:MAG: DUF86 domain-containing protein [Longimicrobiaceae bacterium]